MMRGSHSQSFSFAKRNYIHRSFLCKLYISISASFNSIIFPFFSKGENIHSRLLRDIWSLKKLKRKSRGFEENGMVWCQSTWRALTFTGLKTWNWRRVEGALRPTYLLFASQILHNSLSLQLSTIPSLFSKTCIYISSLHLLNGYWKIKRSRKTTTQYQSHG